MGFEAYLKYWLGNINPINEARSQENNISEFEDLRNIIDGGIGGELSNPTAKTSSFESIDTILSKLDTILLQKVKTKPDLQKILMAMVSPGKVEWLNEYLTKSKKSLNTISSDKKKIDTFSNFDKFTKLTVKEADIKSKIYKIYLIFKYASEMPDLDTDSNILLYIKNEGLSVILSNESDSPKYTIGKIGRVDNLIESNEFEIISDSGESKIVQKEELKNLLELNPEIAEKAKESTSESYRKKIDKIAQRAEQTIKKDVADSLNNTDEVIANLPNDERTMEKLQVDWKPLLDALGYSNYYANTIKKKEEKITTKERPSLRKKNRIREKLMAALRLSLLPPLVNGEISEPGGDYFKLLKTVESKNPAWLEASIREILTSSERISQFNNGPRLKESSLEEDQLAYLHISSNWIIKYIQSEVDGELSKRDMDNAVAKVKSSVQEKEKEVKNYYLSKDFSMKNFEGVQLKPGVKLPLYQKVKLLVSESDRISESPLKNSLKGLGQIAIGLLSTIPINIDKAVAERNAAQNKAIFNGIFNIIKGGLLAVNKPIAREFEKKQTFFKSSEKKTNEDLSPGVAMQTPQTLPDANMDTFALAGPGKKIKKTKKKSTISKILTFKDFLKS